MAAHDKWMQFWIGDYLGDTMHLRTIEHGAYTLILWHLWRTAKPIPDSDPEFRKVTRTTPEEWDEMRTTILAFLTKGAGGWTQKRLTAELKRAENLYKKRSQGGKKTISKINNITKPLETVLKDSSKTAAAQGAVTTLTKSVVKGNGHPPRTAGSAGLGLDAPPADRLETEPEPPPGGWPFGRYLRPGESPVQDILARPFPNTDASEPLPLAADIVPLNPPKRQPGDKPSPLEQPDWHGIISAYAKTGLWDYTIGANPDDPLCAAPKPVLIHFGYISDEDISFVVDEPEVVSTA